MHIGNVSVISKFNFFITYVIIWNQSPAETRTLSSSDSSNSIVLIVVLVVVVVVVVVVLDTVLCISANYTCFSTLTINLLTLSSFDYCSHYFEIALYKPSL